MTNDAQNIKEAHDKRSSKTLLYTESELKKHVTNKKPE